MFHADGNTNGWSYPRSTLDVSSMQSTTGSLGFGRKGRRESPTIKCIIVFMGPFSLVRCGKYRTLISISDLSLHQIFCLILVRLLISRRCSHGNRKSMGFGCEWRRESPTIKCNRKSVYRL
ncbi:hypothetical protein POPTR_019G073801v4 [Populus trichocarpa]|uniref:Uncharacterized protein n=1 Tax=Populus trichocarpa TaxID=3694 RepID=A0ACC0RJU3_POPTR|nr:hypothetical protein POPTR_019G073801v4 [Populus trichocarpa]